MTNKDKYDVVIIGGSYAGMSAAMALGRSRRNVLIVDGGDPCNKTTPYSHNFLTQDGVSPAEIAAKGLEQVLSYSTIEWHAGYVYDIMGELGAFEVFIEKSKMVVAKRVILASGLIDLLPNIPDFNVCWGKTIIHCPYCHGYEFSDQKTGILASAEQTMEMVKLISHWTDDLTLFLYGSEDLNPKHYEIIQKKGVRIIENKIIEVVHQEGKLKHLIMSDGSKESLVALYARLPTKQKITFLKNIGCSIAESNLIEVNMFGKTTVDGIYAIGDCAHPMRSVATAVYTGNIAGAMLNKELIDEDF